MQLNLVRRKNNSTLSHSKLHFLSSINLRDLVFLWQKSMKTKSAFSERLLHPFIHFFVSPSFFSQYWKNSFQITFFQTTEICSEYRAIFNSILSSLSFSHKRSFTLSQSKFLYPEGRKGRHFSLFSFYAHGLFYCNTLHEKFSFGSKDMKVFL